MPPPEPSWLSLLPALVTIALAFLTRQVVASLFAGVLTGSVVLAVQTGNLADANPITSFLLPAIGRPGYAQILLIYLWSLGGLIGLWERTGAAQHFANVVGGAIARGRRSSLVFSWLLGCVFHQGGTVSTVLTGSTAKPMIHIALYQPCIPPNTGNIGRQCVGMGMALHLIGPMSIDLSTQAVKRAGLDYWPHLKLHEYATPEAFLDWLGPRKPWLITKRGETRYDHVPFADQDVIILGNENTGIPPAWHQRWPDRRVTIPLLGPIRSYNLANTAAIIMAQACLVSGAYQK